MLKMNLKRQWAAIAIATLVMGLEPLTASALTSNHGATKVPAIAATELAGQNLVLIARTDRPARKKVKKSKSRKSRRNAAPGSAASAAEVEKFWNVYQAGMRSVSGCITNANAGACDRLSNSKSALTNWCLGGKAEACDLLTTLSSQEGYQSFSDALQQSVQ